jgi:hypothetical protein
MRIMKDPGGFAHAHIPQGAVDELQLHGPVRRTHDTNDKKQLTSMSH